MGGGSDREMLAFQKCLLREAVSCLLFAPSGKFHPQIRNLRIAGCDFLRESTRTNVEDRVAPFPPGVKVCLFVPLAALPAFLTLSPRLRPSGATAAGSVPATTYREPIRGCMPFPLLH